MKNSEINVNLNISNIENMTSHEIKLLYWREVEKLSEADILIRLLTETKTEDANMTHTLCDNLRRRAWFYNARSEQLKNVINP